MKKLLLGCILCFSTSLFAQPYGNEWINYAEGQRYFKIKIAEEGIYRIDRNTLSAALQAIGQSIATIDPRSIQLYGRGEEQHIFVSGESDGSFDNNDFIEFYAQGNDGWLDAQYYPASDQHTNPFYSLYNDTATYYLSWQPAMSNTALRLTSVPYTSPVPTVMNYVIYNEVAHYNQTYQIGKDLGSGKAFIDYEGGKGWMSSRIGYNTNGSEGSRTHTFNTTNRASPSGVNATLSYGLAGVNRGANTPGDEDHHARIETRPGTGGTFTNIKDELFGSDQYIMSSLSLNPNTLGNTNTQFRLRVARDGSLSGANSDYVAIAYWQLKFPHTLNLEGASKLSFEIPAGNNTAHFSATNFSTDNTQFIYDLGLHQRLEVEHSTSNGSLVTNFAAGGQRPAYVSTEAEVTSLLLQDIEPVSVDGLFENPITWSKDSACIILTHTKLMSAAQSYANYRAQNYNVVVVDVTQLYDQFAYGINQHPLALRGFVEYALDEWPSPPQWLFLMGKSIGETQFRKNANLQAQNLVPSMGFPPSDNLITAKMNGSGYAPAIPTGRLAAFTANQVQTYLAKIKEFDAAQSPNPFSYTIDNKKWQKTVLHFGGGSNQFENKRFLQYLDQYSSYIADTLFGADITTFSKTIGSVIQELNTDLLEQKLEEGAALMTFFGHASGVSFDISVDNPSNWNNRGKYPVVVANSCFSGNIHLPVSAVSSVSEEYVFTPNEGSIAFVATPELSTEGPLVNYTTELYRLLSTELYGASLSEQMRSAASLISQGSDPAMKSVALEMTLHGDPMLKLYPHEKPELTINDPMRGIAARTEPTLVTTDIDSFDLVVTVSNLGKATSSNFSLTAERRLADGSLSEIKSVVLSGLLREEEVRLRFPTDIEGAVGVNNFSLRVDLPNSVIDEFDDQTNNSALTLPVNVTSSDIFPIYPYDFAVVPSLEVTLKASTGDPLALARSYNIEIDTTDLYNSPWKQVRQVTQSGGVITWAPDLSSLSGNDSTVFFWRVSPADTAKWKEFSFQHINGREGWGQEHFFQYKNNTVDFIELNRSNRRMEFGETSRQLKAVVLGNPDLSNQNELNRTEYRLDGQLAPFGDYGISPGFPNIAVAVIDSASLLPWGTYAIGASGVFENPENRFGNNNDGGLASRNYRIEYYFTFSVKKPAQMDSLASMLSTRVADGHYLLIWTQVHGALGDTAYWKENHYQAFEALGADSIRFAPRTHPYILFAKKGSPNTAIEVIGKNPNELISLSTKVVTSLKKGSMASTVIGPAKRWNTAFNSLKGLEAPGNDASSIVIAGVAADNAKTVLDTLANNGSLDLSGIDAAQYPYLELELTTTDNTTATPTQLRNWHVLYDPAAELALNQQDGFKDLENDASSGQAMSWVLPVKNVSHVAMDSFMIDYSIKDDAQAVVQAVRTGPHKLAAAEVLFDTLAIASEALAGQYGMYMEVNPLDSSWRKEQYHFNNIAYRAFTVIPDKVSPILDVTFDGVHILDGDIVSPSPNIVMELKDENQYLLMDDTTSFDVYLAKPNQPEKRIAFVQGGQEMMLFEPATAGKNKARLTYHPQGLADGEYKLRVAGKDAANNSSGKTDYTITFNVENRSTVTQVMNYPNPFTTSTRFVFTLTGSVIPDLFTIQILTASGRVVREITIDELGPINIGRNITDYAWDGTDEFGDRLANGVYLYRVKMKIDGESIESRASGADTYFTREFGKMYLFR